MAFDMVNVKQFYKEIFEDVYVAANQKAEDTKRKYLLDKDFRTKLNTDYKFNSEAMSQFSIWRRGSDVASPEAKETSTSDLEAELDLLGY